MRSTLVILAALVATAPALTACSGDSSSQSDTTSSTGSSSASPATGGTTVDITIKAGKVTPNGDRVKATVGAPVTLHIDADKPGSCTCTPARSRRSPSRPAPAPRSSPSTEPGIVDVEDHALEQVIVQLEVS